MHYDCVKKVLNQKVHLKKNTISNSHWDLRDKKNQTNRKTNMKIERKNCS